MSRKNDNGVRSRRTYSTRLLRGRRKFLKVYGIQNQRLEGVYFPHQEPFIGNCQMERQARIVWAFLAQNLFKIYPIYPMIVFF